MNVTVVQLVLGLFTGGGISAAIIAWIKLRPDLNTTAVTQSQSAMEVMALLNKQLEEDRDHWRDRALAAEARLNS